MTDEIVKREGISAIESLRLLRTLDTDDQISIAKTALKDGTWGLAARGMSLLQRWDEGRFWDAFLDELDEMRRAGQIREDFDRTDAGVSSVREFFEMIDGKPDEERFRAFCALFMSANAPGADSNEAILDIELMSILRNLSAGEMHLLSAFLKVRSYVVGEGTVMQSLTRELGYNSHALVRRNVTALLRQSLVDEEAWTNRGGNLRTQKQLLTDLGMALLKRIDKYNEFKDRQTRSADQTDK